MGEMAKILTPESLLYYDREKGYLDRQLADELYMAKDGIKITASKTGTVTTITIIDESGTSTVEINDGAKGETGKAGDDAGIVSIDTSTLTLSSTGKLGLNSNIKIIKSLGTGLTLSSSGQLALSSTVKAIKTGTAVPTTSTISSGEMYLQLES